MHIQLLLDLLDDTHSSVVGPAWCLKTQPLQWVSDPWSWGRNRRPVMRMETLPSLSFFGWMVRWEALLPFACFQYSTAGWGIYFYVWGKYSGRKKRNFANVCLTLLTDILQLSYRDLHYVPKLDENDVSRSTQSVGGSCPKTYFFLTWTRIYLLESLLVPLVNFVH